ncbi:MAG: Flp pilus assembly protein CpaB, partial [Phycisphaerales bacterium]|nr:Flp pilus assembly protein CpaB [Phycisphaerales bacterium]
DLDQIELPSRPAGEPVIATRALAVGRTVSVPLAKGQALRTTDLVVAGSGASIASQLEPGMRAITVSLRDSGPEVVLYPGARVDMLATLERPARVGDQRESVTLTLLEGVRVLAVNDEAVGAKSPAEAAGDRRAASRKLTVALAVTPEQAAQVELASARGTIGIALRPDQERVTSSASGVSVTARSILGLPDVPAAPAPPPSEPAAAKTAPEKSETAAEKAAPPRPVWRVSVTRGDATMTHEMPEAPTTAGAPRQANPTP